MDSWQLLLTGIALALVLEGILPFLYPKWLRKRLEQVQNLPDSALRLAGLLSMLSGAFMLYLLN